MKALGMKSDEVKELFLIESLTMGLLGGVLGLALGFLAGKLLSVGLSVFSIAKGVGIMDISLIPVGFVLVIIFLAILVGIVTGLYPAKRARHISALNALRYE
jgi:putative ABC transport system permease protein